MKREPESLLLDFCVRQRRSFSTAAWARFEAVGPLEKAVAARFLAGVEWYGHREGLAHFADTLTTQKFAELSAATNFDPGRFGGLLKARLARADESP